MGKYISLGKIDRKYIFINLFIFSLESIRVIIEVINNFRFENNKFMNLIPFFLGFIFCFFLELIKNRKNTYKRINDKTIKSNLKVILIIVTSLLFLIFELIDSFLRARIKEDSKRLFKNNNLFIFIFITFIISKSLFKYSYYKHQHISIVIIILLSIIKFLIKLNPIISQNQDVPFINILIIFSMHIIELTCLSLYMIYLKILIENFYFSIYKVTYIIGIINGILSLITYVLISHITIEKNDFFGTVEYKGKYYIDNIYYFGKNFNFFQIISFFIYHILCSFKYVSINIIIEKYPLLYIFLPFQLIIFVTNFVEFFKYSNQHNFASYLLIFIFIFEFFFICIYLEIIELNFCGLSENIKRNIEKRALRDSNQQPFNTLNNIFEINNQYIVNCNDAEEEKNNKSLELKKIKEK